MFCGCVGKGPGRLVERRLPRVIRSDMQKAVMSQTSLNVAEINSLYLRFRQLAPSGEMTFGKFRNTMGMLGMLDDLFLPYRMFCAFDANEDHKVRSEWYKDGNDGIYMIDGANCIASLTSMVVRSFSRVFG